MGQGNRAKLSNLEQQVKQQVDLCRYAYESGFITGCRMAERAERIDWDSLKHCPYANPEQAEAWCEGYTEAFAQAGKLYQAGYMQGRGAA